MPPFRGQIIHCSTCLGGHGAPSPEEQSTSTQIVLGSILDARLRYRHTSWMQLPKLARRSAPLQGVSPNWSKTSIFKPEMSSPTILTVRFSGGENCTFKSIADRISVRTGSRYYGPFVCTPFSSVAPLQAFKVAIAVYDPRRHLGTSLRRSLDWKKEVL